MIQKTVLVENGHIHENTFGSYRDAYLWNIAWCIEHFDRKRIGGEGRNWFGIVRPSGVQQVKDLGWEIKPAKVILL